VAAIFAAGAALAPEADAADAETVRLPRRLMLGWEVLREMHFQTGLTYAHPTGAVARQIDASQFDGAVGADRVAKALAPVVRRRDRTFILESDLSAEELARLGRTLRSGPVDARRLAAYQLGRSKASGAVRPLLRAALNDKNESVRHHALRALHHLERDFRTFAPAGRVSIFEMEGYGLARAFRGLARRSDRTSPEWLWAVELVGRGGRWRLRPNPDAIRAARDHGYARTREVATWTLARFGWNRKKETPPAVEDRRDPASEALVLAALDAKEADDLVKAVRRAGRHNGVGPERLLALYRKQTDDRVRAEILLALGRKGGEPVWDLLLREMKSKNAVIRRAAIRGLRRCPDPRAVDALMQVLAGEDVQGADRNLAGMSLGLIGGETVVRKLTDYVMKTGLPISTTALALGWTGREDAVPALIKCAKVDRKKPSLQSYAFNALGRIGTREAVDAVAARYGAHNNVARYMGHAAIRIAGSRSQEAVDRYVSILSKGRGKIAAHGLEMAEDPRAVDVLIDQIPQSKGTRLFWMVQSLGRIGDPKAVPTLVKLLDHDSESIRYEAMRALRWRGYWHREDVQTALKQHAVFKEVVAPKPSLEDQEPNTWVLRHWPIDFDDYRAVNTSYEAGLAFDGSTGRIVKWGAHGQRCDTPQLGETWLYDPAKNAWERSGAPVEPFGMCGTWGTVYDRANRCVVSVQATGANHGWQWNWGRATRVSVPWLYVGERDKWVPVRAVNNPGPRGFHPLLYHGKRQVVLLYAGQGGWGEKDRPWIYDGYTNTWTLMPPSKSQPGYRTNYGFVYLPEQNRALLTGGSYGQSDNRTLMYELETNTWTDVKAKGNPSQFRQPVEYDPVTKTVLAWRLHAGHAPAVWQYTPKTNTWAKLPPAKGLTPHHDSVDICYDPRHNVFVLDGGHLNWHSDHIAVREVWTYKLTPGGRPKPKGLAAPTGAQVATARYAQDSAQLSWKPLAGAEGYDVYRGAAGAPWKVEFQKAATLGGDVTKWTDKRKLNSKEIVSYQVAAIKDGKEGPPSQIVRTQPRFPVEVTASIRPDRTVDVVWSKSASRDVVGYNVYAARMKVGRRAHPSSMRTFEPFIKFTDKPIKGTAFRDARKLGGPSGFLGHEVRGYVVKAVNAVGIESGPSTMALTLTSSVPSVTATERADGSTLVEWKPVPEKHVRGYAVYRMDEYRHSLCIRLNPHPVRTTRYVDWCEAPKAERRRYYVVAIDALGQRGLPSTGAWAFGRP
jgi:HEAT repeat protein